MHGDLRRRVATAVSNNGKKHALQFVELYLSNLQRPTRVPPTGLQSLRTQQTSSRKAFVQISDFEDIGLLIQLARLVCVFCSSGQRFAGGFLQIPPRDGHPCHPLTIPSAGFVGHFHPDKSALPGATKKALALRSTRAKAH
jgi:hypothetical protein